MKLAHGECSNCEHRFLYSPGLLQASPLRTLPCPSCHADIVPRPPAALMSEVVPRSRDQERRAAARHGARVVAGSGARPLAKGDIQKRGEIRGECKYTSKSSYTLRLEDLKKLDRETRSDEDAIFEIEFQNDRPYRRFYVVPDGAWHRLKGELAELRKKLGR